METKPLPLDLDALVDQLAERLAHRVAEAVRPPDPEGPREDPSKRACSTRQAGEILGVSAQHLKQLRCKGGGPEFFRVGNAVRYRLDKLIEYRDLRTRKHTSEPAPSKAKK